MARRRKLTEFVEPQIAVPINEAEQRVKAHELARVCSELDKLRADAAAEASVSRKRVRALALQQRQLAECVRTGTEMRDAQADLFNRAPEASAVIDPEVDFDVQPADFPPAKPKRTKHKSNGATP